MQVEFGTAKVTEMGPREDVGNVIDEETIGKLTELGYREHSPGI